MANYAYQISDNDHLILKKILLTLQNTGLSVNVTGGIDTSGLATQATLAQVRADTAAIEAHQSTMDTNTAAIEAHQSSMDTQLQVMLPAFDAELTAIYAALTDPAYGVRVGGYSTTVIDSTAVSTSAYSANDIVGGLRTLAVSRKSGYSTVLQSISVVDAGDQKAELIFLFFNANPSASTVADHGALTLNAADVPKVIGTVKILTTDYYDMGSVSAALKTGIGLVLKPASGSNVYCITIATGTPDYVASTDLSISFGVLQD